ncbi:ABC transporter ATP-binding protein [bacterium]|nr:ABC transporter ATP-binding protein [candidate division CSSED10-310 bacterium]
MTDPLLQIRGLTTTFQTSEGTVYAVDALDLDIGRGEVLGLVGESGCGKSVASLSILGLIPSPPGAVTGGTVVFKGRDLRRLSEREMRSIRGKEIAMIFQEPMTSLNPVFTVGDQIMEVIELHERIGRREARQRTLELLNTVAIPDPGRRIDEYPHELSGGMRQRVMIAMALACSPDLLIADEPTTALDVTIQAQIMSLLLELRDKMGLSILLITHDLGVVAETADRVAVMYAGRLVERAAVSTLFQSPLHPYTQGLLRSVPRIDEIDDDVTDQSPGESAIHQRRRKLPTIDGTVPSLINLPPGCAFAPRCAQATDACRESSRLAVMLEPEAGHWVRCILYGSERS